MFTFFQVPLQSNTSHTLVLLLIFVSCFEDFLTKLITLGFFDILEKTIKTVQENSFYLSCAKTKSVREVLLLNNYMQIFLLYLHMEQITKVLASNKFRIFHIADDNIMLFLIGNIGYFISRQTKKGTLWFLMSSRNFCLVECNSC